MQSQLFQAALGIQDPWFVQGVDFDASGRILTVGIDFVAGSRFGHPDAVGVHPVHDTVAKRYRHLNFFQHECVLEVRTPRVKLPDGRVVLVEPPFAGKLSGFTLLFEALVLAMSQQMPFAAVARLVGESWHRVHAICERYVDLAVAAADLSKTTAVAIDETSRERGHRYLTFVADAIERKIIFVTPDKDAKTIAAFSEHLKSHQGNPEQIRSVSVDMSPAFIKGVTQHLPNARITFDKFHVIGHASTAVEKTRRLEQKTDPDLKGLRWALLKDRQHLGAAQRADLDALIAKATTKRTARAWLYKEHLREILNRKQIHVVSTAAPMVHQCHALQGRAYERSRLHDPRTLRRYRRLGANQADQRIPRSHQWSVSSCKAQSAWLHQIQNHENRRLSHRWETQLHRHQSAYRLIHLEFKRTSAPRGLQKHWLEESDRRIAEQRRHHQVDPNVRGGDVTWGWKTSP
jgi:transposase